MKVATTRRYPLLAFNDGTVIDRETCPEGNQARGHWTRQSIPGPEHGRWQEGANAVCACRLPGLEAAAEAARERLEDQAQEAADSREWADW